MSFLDRLKPRPRPRRTAPAVHVRVDRAFGDPEAAAVKAAMTARDWPAVRKALDAGHHQDDFDFLVGVAARVEGSEEWLPDLIRDDGDDLLAPMMFGFRLVSWAWEARTAASARFVSADRWPIFRERLQQAEEVLLDVVRRDPGNVTAWNELIIAGRGLSRPLAEQRKHFDRAVEIDPLNYLAHTSFLQGACAKWQGSHEIMHEFAHTSAAKAPGSRLGALVAIAHWEHWLRWEHADQLKYFQRASVARDLVDAAERSVLHPTYEQRRNWPADNSPFAGAFVFASEFARARQQFETLDGWATDVPWGWMKGGVEAAYLRLHHRAYTS